MPDPASDFDALVEEFYAVWFRYRPDLALIAGVPGYGCLLPAQDDDELAAMVGWLESLLLGLGEVAYLALDPDRRLDYALLAGAARVEHRELRTFDWRRRDPLRFLPLAEIHRLSLEPGDAWLARLLARVPEHLRRAQGELRAAGESLSPILVRAAAREAEAGRCYLRELIRGPWLQGCGPGLAELESLAELVCDALADFKDYLMGELLARAVGPLGCGEGHLILRLGELHFMDADGDQMGEALARALAGIEDEVRGTPPPNPGWPHPAAGTRPVASDESDARPPCEGLRRELEASGLVTLPGARLRFARRPGCPGMGRLAVPYLSHDDGTGTLYLSPVGAGLPPGGPESIRELCLTGGWGGAHLLAFANRPRANRTPRRLANASSLRTGWHLYLDRQLARQASSDPERVCASLARRHACLRLAKLELEVHLGRIDADEALTRLAALGFGGHEGEARLAQVARAPGDALAEAMGWLLLEAARSELQASPGDGLSPRDFHDRLLAQGAVPLPLALGTAFGEPLWIRTWERVFGD